MYIVYETNNVIDSLRCKYLVLELDTVEFSDDKTVKTFAVVDSEHVSLNEMSELNTLTELHENLIKNYRLQNWNYCGQAIEHLLGSFKGELDTFYEALSVRIAILEGATIADDWTGNILVEQTDHSE